MTAFYIGKYEITGGILAPMAGYTDVAFRQLCRERGAGLTVTEMISVRGLVHDCKKTRLLMRLAPNEYPSCLQLFGSDPRDFAAAAGMLDCDIIDINMGCPMPKIVKNGDGSALLDRPDVAAAIVRALKDNTDKPVTVKTRLGVKTGVPRAAELIESVASAGAAAVTVHGRYAEQRYSGEADIAAVRELAAKASIPVIVNGDLESSAAGCMLGRHALFNPNVFAGKPPDPLGTARRHVELLTQYFDERYTVLQARKFFVHYFKGSPGGKALRASVNTANTVADVLAALESEELRIKNEE